MFRYYHNKEIVETANNNSTCSSSSSLMRKVRSLDFSTLHQRRFAIRSTSTTTDEESSSLCASRFSHAAHHRGKFSLRRSGVSLHSKAAAPSDDCCSSRNHLDYSCARFVEHQEALFVDASLRRPTVSTTTSLSSTTEESSSSSLASSSSSSLASSLLEVVDDDPSLRRLLLGTMKSPRNVGYLSVLMLLLCTFTNFALANVHAQMHQLDFGQFINYDALSTEVISPPFSYKRKTTSKNQELQQQQRPRLGLGTAAISSVTSALSPILPFTGGVDLRREEHWDFSLASIIMEQVQVTLGMAPSKSAAAEAILSNIPRAGATTHQKTTRPSVTTTRVVTSSSSPSRKKAYTALSASTPFVPIHEIAAMTLSDVTTLFRYAVESNRVNFDKDDFYSKLEPRLITVLAAMDAAVATSRGQDVDASAETSEQDDVDDDASTSYGDVDALIFCAAMRIFAEWRVLRQVPDGYKKYAVGMNLGHKDVVQNVGKIEKAVHAWIDHNREVLEMQAQLEGDDATSSSTNNRRCTSPTLRQLLQHEIDLEIHPHLPRLKEKTAAMGLLWVRRQLHYQTELFANVIQVPHVYPTMPAAVAAAYKEVYDRYHGWAVQKIFNYSFQAAPQAVEIYKFMNPHYLKEVMEEAASTARQIMTTTDHNMEKTKKDNNVMDDDDDATTVETETSTLDCKDDDDSSSETIVTKNENSSMNPFEKFGNHIAQEWDKLGKHVGGEWDKLSKHVGGEWDKFVSNVVRIFDDKLPPRVSDLDMRGGGGLEGDALESYVTKEMTKDAQRHIVVYLGVAQPLLENLAGLFDVLNMDDPTKV